MAHRATRARGQIILKDKNKYLIRVYLGRVNGKRTYKSKLVHGKYADAKRELTSLLAAKDNGRVVAPSSLRVGEFLERWKEDSGDCNTVRPKTWKGYVELLERYANPHLGGLRLQELSSMHLERLYHRTMLEEQGLSASTVRQTNAALRKAMKWGVRHGLISRDPCDGVPMPRLRRPNLRTLSQEQVRTLLRRAEGSPVEALLWTLFGTGMRPGELLGLRWTDIDLDTGNVRIQRTVTQGSRYEAVLAEDTKTAAGRRSVTLGAPALGKLQQHRARQRKEMLAKGQAYHRGGLVFPNSAGRPRDIRWLRRTFKRLLQEAELPAVRLYDSRHTVATLLFEQGVHPKAVAAQLGHTDIKTTLNTYTHVLPQQEAKTGATLGRLLEGTAAA